jgi:hypothetical protein
LMWSLFALATGRQPYVLPKSDLYPLAALLSVIALLTVHAIISNLQIGGVDFGRFAASCAILTVLLAGAHFAARKLERTSVADLVRAANLALGTLTLLGFAAALGAPPIGPQASPKAVIVFAEPSHFALAYLPILLFRISIAKRHSQILLLAMAFALAIGLQSLTMIAGLLLVSALLLRSISLAIALVILAAGSLAVDLTYYSSRLAFSSDTTNLSTLVFLQGWENAILNFGETAGIGVGFQQFGIAGSIGGMADKIVEILGSNISLRDGGSTSTKLIGEFGVLGIVAIVALVRIIARGALYLRRCQRQPARLRDQRSLFFYSFLVTYTIELFVRGTGYFAPGSFFAAIALISLWRHKPARAIASDTSHIADMNQPGTPLNSA